MNQNKSKQPKKRKTEPKLDLKQAKMTKKIQKKQQQQQKQEKGKHQISQNNPKREKTTQNKPNLV